jgi:hypothetical protein
VSPLLDTLFSSFGAGADVFAGVPLLLQADGAEVREFGWLSPIPTWIWFLVIIPLVALFVISIYKREIRSRDGGTPSTGAASVPQSSLQRVAHRCLIGLRILVILTIIALLAQPIIRTTTYQNLDSSVVVLVDDSLSMDIADKYSSREIVGGVADFFQTTLETIESTKRYDLVGRLFRDTDIALIDRLRKKGKVAVYSFAASLQRRKQFPRAEPEDPPTPSTELEILPPYADVRGDSRVRETRIANALHDVVASERGVGLGGADQRVAAVILLSDGQQTPGARAAAEVARRLGKQGIPVHAVGMGNPDDPKDIRIVSLDVNDVVLAGDLVPFDVALAADGFENERVRVDLKFGGSIAATKYVTLKGTGTRQSERLEYRPPAPGDFVVRVEVERRGGELLVENNAASRAIKVLDKKIRVLYAEGPPRWEYRYLKNALVRDPTMQAQVYLTSADPGFIQESSAGMPPLIEFPSTREELFAYHVIILGDVELERNFSQEQVALLKDFVYEAGGGIVFMAGDHANPSRYLHTDLYNILPVEVPERSEIRLDVNRSAAPETQPFNVELTQAGKEHTVLRLDNDLEANLKLWENKDGQHLEHLPGFLTFQETGKAKKGAIVLARHPEKVHPVQKQGFVIFAFMNYGKGRTFFSAVDETWRWRAGVGDLYFYRFWGQVVRFCATGRLLNNTLRYSITTDKVAYTLGERVNIECRVFDANMKPSTEPTLKVRYQAQSSDAGPAEVIELNLDPIHGQGTYHGGVVASRLGLHDVWIQAVSESRVAFRTFDVTVPALEFRDPRRNSALLQEVAHLSGGRYLEIQDLPEVVDKLEGESQLRQGEVENEPLWDKFWVVLLFTGLISAEWILRKVVNLL